MLAALHVHSDYSHDGRDTLEQVREWALRMGIGAVAMSDHAEDFDPEIWAEYHARCKALSDDRLQLIPGLEFRFRGHGGLHLLAFGLEPWISPHTPEEFLREARAGARLLAVAHPVLFRYALPLAVAEQIDAVEVWNTQYNTRYLPDPEAIALYGVLHRERPELVAFAGLDQHNTANDRRARLVLADGESDPLGAIKAGRFRNRGMTIGFSSRPDWGDASLGLLAAARRGIDALSDWQERRARAARAAQRPAGTPP